MLLHDQHYFTILCMAHHKIHRLPVNNLCNACFTGDSELTDNTVLKMLISAMPFIHIKFKGMTSETEL